MATVMESNSYDREGSVSSHFDPPPPGEALDGSQGDTNHDFDGYLDAPTPGMLTAEEEVDIEPARSEDDINKPSIHLDQLPTASTPTLISAEPLLLKQTTQPQQYAQVGAHAKGIYVAGLAGTQLSRPRTVSPGSLPQLGRPHYGSGATHLGRSSPITPSRSQTPLVCYDSDESDDEVKVTAPNPAIPPPSTRHAINQMLDRSQVPQHDPEFLPPAPFPDGLRNHTRSPSSYYGISSSPKIPPEAATAPVTPSTRHYHTTVSPEVRDTAEKSPMEKKRPRVPSPTMNISQPPKRMKSSGASTPFLDDSSDGDERARPQPLKSEPIKLPGPRLKKLDKGRLKMMLGMKAQGAVDSIQSQTKEGYGGPDTTKHQTGGLVAQIKANSPNGISIEAMNPRLVPEAAAGALEAGHKNLTENPEVTSKTNTTISGPRSLPGSAAKTQQTGSPGPNVSESLPVSQLRETSGKSSSPQVRESTAPGRPKPDEVQKTGVSIPAFQSMPAPRNGASPQPSNPKAMPPKPLASQDVKQIADRVRRAVSEASPKSDDTSAVGSNVPTQKEASATALEKKRKPDGTVKQSRPAKKLTNQRLFKAVGKESPLEKARRAPQVLENSLKFAKPGTKLEGYPGVTSSEPKSNKLEERNATSNTVQSLADTASIQKNTLPRSGEPISRVNSNVRGLGSSILVAKSSAPTTPAPMSPAELTLSERSAKIEPSKSVKPDAPINLANSELDKLIETSKPTELNRPMEPNAPINLAKPNDPVNSGDGMDLGPDTSFDEGVAANTIPGDTQNPSEAIKSAEHSKPNVPESTSTFDPVQQSHETSKSEEHHEQVESVAKSEPIQQVTQLQLEKVRLENTASETTAESASGNKKQLSTSPRTSPAIETTQTPPTVEGNLPAPIDPELIKAEPFKFFEYGIFQQVYSETDDPATITAQQIIKHSFQDIEVANAQASQFIQAMKASSSIYSVQFQECRETREEHDCLSFTGTFVTANTDHAGRKHIHKIWVQRIPVLQCDPLQVDTKAPFINKTLYIVRLCRIILPESAAVEDEDEDDEDDEDDEEKMDVDSDPSSSNPPEPILQYESLSSPAIAKLSAIFSDIYTVNDLANRAAKRLQVALSHKKEPTNAMDKTWQEGQLRQLQDKVDGLLLRPDEEKGGRGGRGCWETEFNGLGGEKYRLWVEPVKVFGPRNI